MGCATSAPGGHNMKDKTIETDMMTQVPRAPTDIAHMGAKGWFVLVGALAVMATGCNMGMDGDSKGHSGDPESASEKRGEAITAITDYTYAQKEEFVDAAQRELSDIQAEMDRLRTKVDNSTGEVRADAKAKLEVVREKWAVVKAQVDEAETATEETWEDVQQGYQTAQSDLT